MPKPSEVLHRLFAAAHATAGVVLGGTVLLVTMLRPNRAGSERARKGAEQIIAASLAFQQRHGRLPSMLEELVPEFLPAVPEAKYSGPHFGFVYDVGPDSGRHVLSWTEHIPFGRPFYVFEEDRWGYLD
jgi:hypothetical protein